MLQSTAWRMSYLHGKQFYKSVWLPVMGDICINSRAGGFNVRTNTYHVKATNQQRTTDVQDVPYKNMY